MREPKVLGHRHITKKRYQRLGILFFCLLLTVVITVFSIWYNLNHFSSSSPDLFDFISNRLEKGFQEPNPISNR